jgi:general secretion pathway protein N
MRARSSASLMLALAGLGGIYACAVAAVVGFAFDPLGTVPAAVEPARDPGATTGATSNAPVGNPLWAVPLSALSATGDRPIFSPSRRPPAPPAIAAPPPAPRPPPPPVAQEADRPALVLVGTAVGGSRRLGVFLEEATKKLVRLEPGNGHDGWSLLRVERREAQFEKAPRAAILALRPAAGPEPAAGSMRAPVPVQPPAGPQPVTGSVDARATPRLPLQPAKASPGASATEEPVPAVYHRKR